MSRRSRRPGRDQRQANTSPELHDLEHITLDDDNPQQDNGREPQVTRMFQDSDIQRELSEIVGDRGADVPGDNNAPGSSRVVDEEDDDDLEYMDLPPSES